MRQANEVVVTALDKRYKKLEKNLGKRADEALRFLKEKKAHLEIYLVGTPKMRTLNRRYRGKDRPTNVLSFRESRVFPKVGPKVLGEIYLCPPFIKREGQDAGTLLVHGILHLKGFNHEGRSDRMIMERLEEELSLTLQGSKKSKILRGAKKQK